MVRELLTAEEHEALQVSARLANLLRQIIGDGPQASHDWNEAAQRIHAVQHMILAQAAARAYPEKYRGLGNFVTPMQAKGSPAVAGGTVVERDR
jgi:hypothetical protein